MKNRESNGAVLLVLVLTIGLLSCTKNPAGVYVNSKEPSVIMELKGDGSFSIHPKGVADVQVAGSYTVSGSTITFAMAGAGKTGTGKIDGDNIVDPDGHTWKKQ